MNKTVYIAGSIILIGLLAVYFATKETSKSFLVNLDNTKINAPNVNVGTNIAGILSLFTSSYSKLAGTAIDKVQQQKVNQNNGTA